MIKKVGIKTDYDNRLRGIGEMISGDLDGLVAVLGNGLFVVTEEAAEELTKREIEFEDVKINKGIPTDVRKFIREKAIAKGVAPPF